MRTKRISVWALKWATTAARAIVAACLAFSFFSPLVPLRASADNGAMACCAGKAGHCNSGLSLKQPPKPKPKPELLCGLTPGANDEGKATTEAATEDAEITAGDRLVAETIYDAVTIDATSSAGADQRATAAGGGGETSARETTTSTSTSPATSPAVHSSFAKPCPPDCRAGTAAAARQPRPREAALPVKASRGVFAGKASWNPHSPEANLALSATLKRARPRGPPTSA